MRGESPLPEDVVGLCTRFQGGDADALEELCRVFEKPLLRFLYFLTNNEEAAAELAQETWLQAIVKKDSLRDPARFKAWLFRIAQRRLFARFRGRQVVTISFPEEVEGDDLPPEDLMIREEEQSAVLSAIDALPPNRKALVWLVVVEECSHAEASVILDIPEGTARSRLHYTLRNLRETVSRKGIWQ